MQNNNLNDAALMFFSNMLGKAEKKVLKKFLKDNPLICSNGRSGKITHIDMAFLKINGRYQSDYTPIPNKMKEVYNSLVLEEVYNIVAKLLNL